MRISDRVDHTDWLTGEDIELVRPYVLAWEKRVRLRSMAPDPHLSTEPWSTLAGAL
ncbi:hypothetical protein [Streptomyces sp. NPDC014734]|uniref:hypothetical protein n=1 Tax=Streptomyces sp. NPDC014734 TaxID=3364886 RepID=UPI0036F628E8